MMNTTRQLKTTSTAQAMVTPKAVQSNAERRFCPSMFCFTDEITVRRVSTKAAVWLLTDDLDDRSWLMMGNEPTCPHCGTVLL
jgi:hypothetical protein